MEQTHLPQNALQSRWPCSTFPRHVRVACQPRPSRKEGLSGSWPPEQTDLQATLPPSEVKREGPVECKLSRSDDEAGNGRVGVSVSERRSPQVRSVTRRR